MRPLFSILFALTLTAGVLTSCASPEEKLAQQGCDCLSKEDQQEARKCLDAMADETPKLRDDKEYGKKIRNMIKEKCPEAAEKAM